MRTTEFIKRCLAAGMPVDMALTAAALFEEEVRFAVDAVLEPKRAKDRDRKRRIPRNSTESTESTESAEFQETPPPPSFPPKPPLPPTPTRECVTTRGACDREDAGWVKFWSAYPRHVGKAEARKAFGKAWRKLPPFDEEQILIGGLERAKAGWADIEPQYIAHAATWLNQERWTDEPDPPSPATAPRKANVERPNPDQRYTARQDNLARHQRGAELAARLYGEPG